MNRSRIFALPAGFCIKHLVVTAHQVTLQIDSRHANRHCPQCGQRAQRVHSRYVRTITDVASSGRHVTLLLQVGKFFCDTVDCAVSIFTERFPDFLRSSARKTNRLLHQLLELGQMLGGRATERLAPHLGLTVTDATVLHELDQLPAAPKPFVTILGVDDFAFRRRQTYGTILVDLERHCVIDLLPDRSQITFALWLQDHPEVQVISRDRGGDYAAGATLGAPHAQQVADRFHLIKNAGEVLERLLTRKHAALVQAATQVASADAPSRHRPQCLSEQRHEEERRIPRLERFTQVVDLYRQGVPAYRIAHQTGLARTTVLSYIRAETFPEQGSRPRQRLIDPYLASLREQWQAGEHNARVLWRAVCLQGFTGGEKEVRRAIHPWRADPHKRGRAFTQDAGTAQHERACYSSPATHWLLLKDAKDRSAEEAHYVTCLLATCPEIAQASEFLTQFHDILLTHDAARFPDWLQRGQQSQIPEIVGFAQGIQRDLCAVLAAITTNWSQGQVEGQVNRLKMIKRQMYGRAGFALLRKRVLGELLLAA